jgi:hypothetical protein
MWPEIAWLGGPPARFAGTAPGIAATHHGLGQALPNRFLAGSENETPFRNLEYRSGRV